MNAKEIQQYLSAYRKEAKESFIDNLIANPSPKPRRAYRPAAPAPSAAPAPLPARPVKDIGKLDWFTKHLAEPSVKKPSTGKVYTPSFGKRVSDATIPVKNSIRNAGKALVNAAKNNPKTAIALGVGAPLAVAAGVGVKKHLDNKAAWAAAAERNKKMAFGAGAVAGAGVRAVGAGAAAVGLAYLLYRAMKKKNRA